VTGEKAFYARLRGLLAGEIRFAEPASEHTSLGVGGPIDVLAFPENEGQLLALVRFLTENQIPFQPVGNWTNLIVTDGGYRGVLVSLRRLIGLRESQCEGGIVLLEAQAGIPLAQIVQCSLERSLTGMEFCAGIPGSVGGAVRMNAGAYGGEIKDVVTALHLLDPTGQVRTETTDMLHFAYRSLDLPDKTIIIGAVFRLHRGDGKRITARVGDILAARREKHPLAFRNAGSVFKNLGDIAAGRLIEAAGLKGTRIGDAQVSEQHANFIINRGAATATDIMNLIDLIQRRVFAATGKRLETEVKIIGT